MFISCSIILSSQQLQHLWTKVVCICSREVEKQICVDEEWSDGKGEGDRKEGCHPHHYQVVVFIVSLFKYFIC